MQHFVDAARLASEQKNWYAALSLALTLPDICGRIAYPALGKASEKRVVSWFHTYLAPSYPMQFMTGGDFYALRCAYLHQGEFSLVGQSAKKVLDRFHLTTPGAGIIHCNLLIRQDAQGKRSDPTLQLSVDRFCEEICQAVEHWLADVAQDARVQSELNALARLANPHSF